MSHPPHSHPEYPGQDQTPGQNQNSGHYQYPHQGAYPPQGQYSQQWQPVSSQSSSSSGWSGGQAGTTTFTASEPPRDSTQQRKGRGARPGWAAVILTAILAGGVGAGTTAAVMNSHVEGLTNSAPSRPLPQTAPPPVSGDSQDWTAAAEHVRPSVVAIQVRSGQSGGQGSGVIIDAEGHIVTNHHVVGGANQIQVMLSDGRVLQAELRGSDEATDLAVIQLVDAPDDLVPAELGTSSELEVGQAVMAVGNPLGLSSTVTTGIISALDRPVSAGDGRTVSTVTNAIQIDAAINPGNSGGPLFNAAGQVIGINSSIATTSRDAGSVGLGFAIPVDLVANIASQLMEDGVAEHAYLGVTLGDSTATVDGVTKVGAVVGDVLDGTPAQLAGIKSGDVIIAIDDRPVGSAEALTGFVRTYRAGDEVTITLVRSGAEQTVTATLTTREDM